MSEGPSDTTSGHAVGDPESRDTHGVSGWIRQRTRLTEENRYAYKLILPAIAMMFIIHFVPIVWGFAISFMELDALYIARWTEAPFTGLSNYTRVLDPATIVGQRYWFSLRQTLIFTVGSVGGAYVLGLITALILNRGFRGSKVARTLILLPWISPIVVVLLTWRMMLLSDTGIINHLLQTAGIIDEPILWLLGSKTIISVTLTNVWIYFPWATIMLFAGLKSIPNQLYEAASIDGAGRWGKFRYVTLPQLKPVSAVVVLLMVLWSMINFTVPFVLTGGGSGRHGEVLMLFIYNYAFQNYEFGLGAAMSVALFLVAMVLAMVYYRRVIDDSFGGGIGG
ncbi:sugar ABC transporter permease [Halostella sp. PRR32]|uniref:carbohydrate ABC transporter permease n=1 Tax=Halostella sp. PRR32 TaxID=3098147 RepID=UPI002B1D381D|nr:sugar ABC transporter permease [Halostella sp. PRR32]